MHSPLDSLVLHACPVPPPLQPPPTACASCSTACPRRCLRRAVRAGGSPRSTGRAPTSSLGWSTPSVRCWPAGRVPACAREQATAGQTAVLPCQCRSPHPPSSIQPPLHPTSPPSNLPSPPSLSLVLRSRHHLRFHRAGGGQLHHAAQAQVRRRQRARRGGAAARAHRACVGPVHGEPALAARAWLWLCKRGVAGARGGLSRWLPGSRHPWRLAG